MPSYPIEQRVYGPAYSPMTAKIRERDAQRAAERAAGEQALRNAISAASMSIELNVADSYANAAAAGAGLACAAVGALADAILSHNISETVMLRANTEICQQAQRAAFGGFTGRTPRRSPGLSSLYASLRSNRNRSAKGALRRAILSSEFFEATPRSIRFINSDMLNKEASHWKRLNFGAGAGAVAPPGRFQLELGGQLIGAAIGLEPDPRPGFSLPVGFFLGATGKWQPPGSPGSGVFIPVSKTKAQYTYGIVTTNFLDAGVKSLVRGMGTRYMQVLDEYMRSLSAGETGTATVTVTIPTTFVRGKAAAGRGERPDLSGAMKAQLNANLNHWLANIHPRELINSSPARRLKPPVELI